jgi:3-deoxy-D-manno-octulosonic-acid transferase
MTHWLYAILLVILSPWLLIDSLRRFFRAPKNQRVLGAQFGRLPAGLPVGGVWLHAVSLGEVRAAAALIAAMRARWPGLPLVVSTTTETGANAARALGVPHFYAPFDYAFAQRAVLRGLQPRLIIVMETELWPNWVRAARARLVPVVVVNARLSDRSFARYQRWGGALLRETLGGLAAICAQSALDRARFSTLAAGLLLDVRDCGNIKFDGVAPVVSPWVGGDGRPIWLAASTHEGEEIQVLAAHRALLQHNPAALLVLAPRHPERSARVGAQIAACGLKAERVSHLPSDAPAPVQADTQVVLLDETGQLMRYFAGIAVVFMGGSLVATGGHNPIEPALFGRAVLSGRAVHNFREVYAVLDAKDALWWVDNDSQLAQAVQMAWDDPVRWQAMGQRARAVVMDNRGATERLLQLIDELLTR